MRQSTLCSVAFSALKHEKSDRKHSSGHKHGSGVYKYARRYFARADRAAAKTFCRISQED